METFGQEEYISIASHPFTIIPITKRRQDSMALGKRIQYSGHIKIGSMILLALLSQSLLVPKEQSHGHQRQLHLQSWDVTEESRIKIQHCIQES